MVDKIGHYSLTNPASVYDEEALTALELAGRTAAKVNECIDEVNKIPETVAEDVQKHIENGRFDKQIDEHNADIITAVNESAIAYENRFIAHTKQTNDRINGLVGLKEGSTTGDAELMDVRTAVDGVVHGSAGDAVRSQVLKMTPNVTFFKYYLDINTNEKSVSIATNGNNNFLYSINERDSVTKVYAVTATPNNINYENVVGAVGVWLNAANPEAPYLFATSVATGGHTPAYRDILLCIIYGGEVYPVSLGGWNIRINGSVITPTPNGMRNNTTTKFILYRGKMIVNTDTQRIQFLKGTYFGMPFYDHGVRTIPINLSLSYEVTSVVQYVVWDIEKTSYSIKDRFYDFPDNMICLGYLYNGSFTPVEIPAECVQYVGANPAIKPTHTSMTDFFTGLTNTEKTMKITLIGDSITHGVGGSGFAEDGELIIDTGNQYKRNTSGYCWANLFKDYIETNYNATVTNNAIRGWFSGTLDKYKESLIPKESDLVIITIGTNNRSALSGYGITDKNSALTVFYNNMKTVVDYCYTHRIPVILCTCIPESKANAESGKLCKVQHINDVTKKLCSEYGLPVADIYNEFYYYCYNKGINYESLLGDGLHPNDAGYRVLYYCYLKAFGLNPDIVPAD